jgi:hypothetical protein
VVIYLPRLVARVYATYLALLARRIPVYVVDLDDPSTLPVHWRPLLRKARLVFKRELPLDRWRVFSGTFHASVPSTPFRARPANRAIVAKLRPVPLTLTPASEALAHQDWLAPPKTADVFFSGMTEASSWIREQGRREIEALAASGLRIDIPAHRLPVDAFLRRMASAWLAWSPEGIGWHCFRHYEAAAVGAVPVINAPTVEQDDGLVHGVHCFHYEASPGELTRVVTDALADKERLRRMAAAARAQALSRHTAAALRQRLAAAIAADLRPTN